MSKMLTTDQIDEALQDGDFYCKNCGYRKSLHGDDHPTNQAGRSVIEFEVIGVPKPQGSMKAFNAGGHARMKPSGGADFAAWRNAVSQAAKDVANGEAALDGPLALVVTFRFPMPASRPKRDRERGEAWKTTAPDTDKLVRTIGDALTAANLIADDARFAIVNATKVETTGWTGAIVRVERLAA